MIGRDDNDDLDAIGMKDRARPDTQINLRTSEARFLKHSPSPPRVPLPSLFPALIFPSLCVAIIRAPEGHQRIYEQIGPLGGRAGKEADSTRGKPLPPTERRGDTWSLVRARLIIKPATRVCRRRSKIARSLAAPWEPLRVGNKAITRPRPLGRYSIRGGN
jgi:hypothetical protein